MHNLVIDIGNTNTKLAVFNGQKLEHFERLEVLEKKHLESLFDVFPLKNFTISSVNTAIQEWVDYLKERLVYFPFSTKVLGGIKNEYLTLDTLGLDRWAKVIAAHCLYPGKSCLLIDAGTCITYDVLSEDQVYRGGSISLGFRMRFEALHHFTGRLPLVEWHRSDEIPYGNSTENAIRNGVLQGAVNEVAGFIAAEKAKNSQLLILITGGDADFLTEQLKNSIFASQIIKEPYLVLKGLNEVITL